MGNFIVERRVVSTGLALGWVLRAAIGRDLCCWSLEQLQTAIGIRSGVDNIWAISEDEPPRVARGIGRPGDDEDPEPLVCGSDIRGAYTDPFRIEPEAGQVSENSSECSQTMLRCPPRCVSHTPRAGFHVAMGSGTEQPSNVFEDDKIGPQDGNEAGYMDPESGAGAGHKPFLTPSKGNVRAGEASGDDVHALDGDRVGCGDVTEVRHARVVVGEQFDRCVVPASRLVDWAAGIGDPPQLYWPQRVGDCVIESAESGAE